MINETAKASYYRYLVNLEVLIPKQNPIKINNVNIGSILMEKDFDNNFFPILCVNLFLETDIYYQIMKNRTTVRFKLKIEKYIYPENETNTIKYRELVFNEIFTTYIKDNDPNIYKDLINQTESGGVDAVPYKGINYDLYLFKETDMNSSKKMINTVIQSGTMTDVLTFLFSKSGIKKVLMAPLDNTEVYNEILLLPTTVIQNVVYLEKQYGFYKNGTVFFYDFDTVYIIPKSAFATAYKTGEYRSTILTYYKSDSAIAASPGSYRDTTRKQNIIHINRDSIYFKSNALLDEQVTGSTLSFIDPITNEVTSITPDVENKNSKNTKVVINNLSNKYLPTMIENQKIEEDSTISVLLYDFDIDAITPNKKIVMSFEDTEIQKKYGGNYRVSYTKLVLNKQGEEFDIAGEVTIKRPM